MGWMANAQKKVQRFTYYVSAMSIFVIIPMMLLTASDVITRTTFHKPLPGVVETSSYMLATVILLGVAYTHQVKGHPRVTILVSRLPLHMGITVEIVINLLCLGMASIIIWQGWTVARSDVGKIVSDVLRIPQLPFRLLVPFGGVLLFLEYLVDFFTSLERLFGKQPPREETKE